jgi:hypothetical protein
VSTELAAPSRSLMQIADDLLQIFEVLDSAEPDDKPAIEAELDRIVATELASKVDGIAFFQKRCDAEVAIREEMCREIEQSIGVWNKRKLRVRDTTKRAMKYIGASLIKGKAHSISLRAGVESLVIEDESQIPDNYKQVRTTITVDVDKSALKLDLKDGKKVAGAKLVRGDEVLTIR